MQTRATPIRTQARRNRQLLILALAILVAAVLVLVVYVWYPTTLQPEVTLTDQHFVGSSCAPVLGGYANRFNATFTLVNAGRADADVWVQFLYNGSSLGYQDYFVPQGSLVAGEGLIIWEVHSSATDCGPLGTPGVALGSVARSPAIDERALIQTAVGPTSALGYMGLLFGVLFVLGRRHGISLFGDLGSAGWSVGVLTALASILFSDITSLAATTPYNYPPDWTPAIVSGVLWGTIGVVLFIVACRELLRKGVSRSP